MCVHGGTTFSPTPTLSLQTPQNFHVWNSRRSVWFCPHEPYLAENKDDGAIDGEDRLRDHSLIRLLSHNTSVWQTHEWTEIFRL